MKCGSAWKGKSVNMATKEEYTPGQLTSIRDNFRVYDSMEEGVAGYYGFINWSRYANLKTATTPQQYAEMLKADGYATSSTYVNTLMKIVNNYNLTAWDNFESTPATAPAEAPTVPQTVLNYLVGKTYTLQAEMKVRKGPGLNYGWERHNELTAEGRKNDQGTDDSDYYVVGLRLLVDAGCATDRRKR